MARVTSGSLMIATGIIHNAFGLLLGFGLLAPPGGTRRNLVAEMATGGVIDSVGGDPLRMTFFWFEFSGAVAFVLGWLMLTVERRGEALAAGIGWQLLAIAVVGVALVPALGLWLVLAQALLILYRARRARLPSGPGAAA